MELASSESTARNFSLPQRLQQYLLKSLAQLTMHDECVFLVLQKVVQDEVAQVYVLLP